MSLMPVLYLSSVGLLGYLIYVHATENTFILQPSGPGARSYVGRFLIYMAPIVVGSIVILFLLKPFFARSSRDGARRSLTPQGEPLLFAQVAKICEEVQAPMPKRIDVVNEVNASASFRNGFWSMLRGNDLVLTIGMPLVQGLSLQEFTGVLAHEFGHFSQGAGMRLASMLRGVSQWLHRAVYERDHWDYRLEALSQNMDFRISWILYLARGAIWLSRRLLWVFLMAGYALTGYILKLMEYDADRYEASMVGRKSFEATSRKLRILGVGYSRALETLGRIMQEGKRIDNFAVLSRAHSNNLPPEVHKKIEEIYATEKSVWYQSHPCDRDRVAAVANFPELGRFRSDLPATALFRNFDAICVGVTEDFYKAALGFQATNLKRVTAQSVLEEDSILDRGWELLSQFFLGTIAPNRTFPLPGYSLSTTETLEEHVALLKQSRSVLVTSKPHYLTIQGTKEWSDLKHQRQLQFEALKKCMSKMDPAMFQIAPLDRSGLLEDPNEEKANLFVRAMTTRLYIACNMLKFPTIASKIEKSDEMEKQVGRILRSLEWLDSELTTVLEFSQKFEYFIMFLQQLQKQSGDNDPLIREAFWHSKNLVNSMQEIRRRGKDYLYPFDHATTDLSMGAFLVPELIIHENLGDVAETASKFLDAFYALRGRCLGYLVVAAQSVEDTLGLHSLSDEESTATARS